MKTIFALITLIGCSYMVLNAQESFIVKTSGPNEFNSPMDMIVSPEENIFFMYSSKPTDSSTVYTNKIVKLNPLGEIENTFSYADTVHNFVEYYYGLLEDDTLYVFGFGYRKVSPNTHHIFLLTQSFDLQLNLICTNRTYLEQLYPYSALRGRIKYIDGNFNCISAFDGNLYRAFHAEISKQGEVIKLDIAGEIGKTLVPLDFRMGHGEGFQVYSSSAGYVAPYTMSGLLTKHNRDFEIESFLPLPYNFFHFYTHEALNDSVCYLAGEWFDVNSAIFWRAGLLKMKNDTTVVDEFLYTTYPDSATCPAYYNSLQILPDGNIIFCFTGGLQNHLWPQDQAAQINLMKLTPDLDVIWHRYIGEPETKYDAYKMHTNEADEIIILGACSQAQPGFNLDMEVLLIKTTPDGLITGIDEDMPGIRSTETLMYPNPAQEFVMAEFSRAYQEATLVITNLNGQEVLKTMLTANKQQVDITGVPAGNYVYQIFNQKGLNESGKLVVGR